MGPRPGQRVRARDARAAPGPELHGLGDANASARRGSARRGSPAASSSGEPVGARPSGEPLAEDLDELRPVFDALAVRGESLVRREPGESERGAQLRPLALAADADGDLAVRGRERLVRDDARVGVAEPAGRRAGHERACAWLTRIASVLCSSETSIRWPPRGRGRPLARDAAPPASTPPRTAP